MPVMSRVIAALAIGMLACGLATAAPLTLGIAAAKVVNDPAINQVALNLELTPASKQEFAAFTTANVGKTIDLSIDGTVVMSPRLLDPILGGEIMVSGTFGEGELKQIAERISAGDAKVAVDVKSD